VVASLVLCTVAELDRALAEAHRVLRPGGTLRFYEHVRAENPRLARWQDRLQRPWGWLAGPATPTGHGGRHHRRRAAGGAAERFDLQAMPPLARPHVLGVAERPR
jgi:SAM-dependent methyltransferase